MSKTGIAITAIIVVLWLILAGGAYIWYENNKEIKDEEGLEEDIPYVFNDTITPKGHKQGFILEIDRIHKMGIEENFRRIGNAWKTKPSYRFEILADDGLWNGLPRNYTTTILRP